MSDINWTDIRKDYEAGGISLRQLATKYSVSKTYLIERRDKEAWNRPDRPPMHRPATTAQASTDDNPTTEKKDLSTKDKQRLFLDAYATHANVMVSARNAGIHRSTVYEWLEHDTDFSFAYNLAKEDAKDILRAEIYRRGVEGWDEKVFQLGLYAGTVRKYDTTLLIFHSKMLMPEYRDKSQVDVNATTNGADVQAMQDAIMAALANHPEARVAVAEALMDKARGNTK